MEEAAEKERPGFFRVGSDVVKTGALKAMTPADVKVYLVLALHANWRTGKCWPSFKTIRELTGCAHTAIKSAIHYLAEIGAISYRKTKGVRGLRNEYTVFRILHPSSGTCDRERSRKQKRDGSGRFATVNGQGIATVDGHQSGTVSGRRTRFILTRLKEQDRNQDAPPAPSRGSGHASETSARPMLTISEATIRKLLEIKSKPEVLDLLRKGSYPIPDFLLAGEDVLKENA